MNTWENLTREKSHLYICSDTMSDTLKNFLHFLHFSYLSDSTRRRCKKHVFSIQDT